MLLNIAKQRFHDGAIIKMHAVRAVMSQGWHLEIATKDGHQTLLHTSKGDAKVYLKADSLISDVSRIQGSDVRVFSF